MIPHDQAPEHEFEAAHGLPQMLPEGEHLLWQGAPDWRVMARDALHLRGIAIYFGLMLAWRGANVLGHGGSTADALLAVGFLLPLAVLALGLLALFAWLVARTSVYTMTDRRVVMRIGIVLTITFNLPYAQVEGADLRGRADGSGDLTLTLAESDHIAFLHLWPHARPWQVKRPQPMMRALRDARAAASVLSSALADSAGLGRPQLPPAVAPERLAGRPATAGAPQHQLAA